ncbi:hypothetical protein EST54_22320 [Streptomyces sioyaensis]|uniref:Uncharacterized protein n=1 Tax=Streptomyces sioyaensis TaxID=67364 RepID=A0A4Q1QNA6_9ACTN|nr:hypothetical protein EST54_22320 [Streptomyces sioyaensis]
MISPGPGNGHWVRTRTEEDRAAFLTEKRAEQERMMHPGAGAAVVLVVAACLLLAWLLWAMF